MTCGTPRIHRRVLKLGIDLALSTVAKYMNRRHHGVNLHELELISRDRSYDLLGVS
jgi:hypothetical protein